MVGDMISDVLAGINAGCWGSILVRTGKSLTDAEARLKANYRAADGLLAAADLILQSPPGEDPEARADRAPANDTLQGPNQ
jgi:D-glycero-D-manno-heptose 1,7-bisphosphate phosphatase